MDRGISKSHQGVCFSGGTGGEGRLRRLEGSVIVGVNTRERDRRVYKPDHSGGQRSILQSMWIQMSAQ